MKKMFIIIFLFFFTSLLLLPSIMASSLDNGIVLYYKMDEQNPSLIIDAVGNNNGTGTNGLNISGLVNTGYNFSSATTNHIVTDNNIDIYGSQPRSVSLWVKSAVTGTNKYLLSWGVTGSEYKMFALVIDSTKLRFASWGGDYDTGIVVSGVSEWRHIVITYNGTHIATYYNGTATPTTNQLIPLDTTNSKLFIAQRFDGDSSSRITSAFDEFAVWNRSLNSTEVLSLYNMGLNGTQYPFTIPEPEPETTNISSVELSVNTTSILVNETFFWSVSYTPTNATNVSLSVDFDNFLTSTDNNGTYNYSSAGLYNLSVNATDGPGNSVYDSIIINVTSPSIPEIPEEIVNMSTVSFSALDGNNISIIGFSININSGEFLYTTTGETLEVDISDERISEELFNLSFSKFGYYTTIANNINLSSLTYETTIIPKILEEEEGEGLDEKSVIWIILAIVGGIGVSSIFSSPMIIVFGFSIMFLTYFLSSNIMIAYYWFPPLGYILGAIIILTGMLRLGFGNKF